MTWTALNRNSSGQSFRVGTTFQLTGYLIGEFAVGRLERIYVDPAFRRTCAAPLMDASLTYYANPLTTLKLDILRRSATDFRRRCCHAG